MKAILLLAWRNLWRNRRRTALTVAGVSFAAAILIFFQSIQFSAFDASISTTSHVLTGHIQLQRGDYLARPELERSFRNPAGLVEAIRAVPHVAGASPAAETSAIVSTGERSFVAVVTGVDPKGERSVSTVPTRVLPGGRYLSESAFGETVVGEKLARNLGIRPGDEISLVGQYSDGSIVSEVLTVTGIVKSGLAEVDRVMVHISLATFDQLFAMNGAIHRVKVLAEAVDFLPAVQAGVVRAAAASGTDGPQLAARTWDELLPGLKQAIDLDMSASWMFYGALLLVCALSVLNTFLMAVLERESEFALLLALGLRPLHVGFSIVAESILLVALGLLGGAAAAAVLVAYYGASGFAIPGSEEMLKVWGLPSRLHPRFLPVPWLRGVGAVLIVGLLSIVFPLLRIRTLTPVEARR